MKMDQLFLKQDQMVLKQDQMVLTRGFGILKSLVECKNFNFHSIKLYILLNGCAIKLRSGTGG